MATDDGGKRRVLWCLIIARFTAATVVAVLAVAGIVVVLTAGLRPEDISLAVTHGHIQAAQIMWLKSDFPLNHVWRPRPEILSMYKPVQKVDFLVSMHVLNPTGRSNTTCYISTVLIFDMPNAPSFTGMKHIASLNVDYGFRVTGHSMDRWISMQDSATLAYIATTYGGISEFTAMLKVNMTIISGTMPPRRTNSAQYCWPVIIGHSRSTTAEALTCKPGHNIDYSADSMALAPPPPPSSAPPPPPSSARPPTPMVYLP